MASLSLTWIQLATAVGALQGLLLSVALAAQRTNPHANRLLAALMGSFTLFLAGNVYYTAGLVEAFPHFFGVSYQTPWLFGPLVYLYALAASDRSWRFSRQHLLHFVPVAVSIAVSSPFYFLSAPEKVAMYERLLSGDVPARLAVIDPFKYVSGLAYSVATVAYLRRHRRRVEHSYSNTKRINLDWLLWLSGAAAGIWVLATIIGVTPLGEALRDEPVSLAIAVLVYLIGYMGLKQPEVFRYETAEYPIPIRPTASAQVDQPADPVTSRYERSGLDAAEASEIRQSLLDVMDRQQPWKESELTLADLATRLGTSPHKLSEVLNSAMSQTFYDFVNGYRVKEVQRRIEAGEAERRKMLALALDAGFASKSTFNQAFKKHTNLTPSDYRERATGRGQSPDRAA
jgi:AraC-like DNA-binding protein